MTDTTGTTGTNRTVRETLSGIGWRRILLSGVVLVVLGLFLVFGFWRDLVFVFTGWFDVGVELFAEDYESVPPHRIHIFIFAVLLWTAAAGLLAQLRSPRRNVAGQWMAVLPWAGLLLAMVVSDFLAPLPVVGIFGGLTLVAMVLHPAGRDLIRVGSVARIHRGMLVLVLLAAIPLLVFAATQIGLQTGAIEPVHAHDHGGTNHEAVHQEHVEAGHFAGAAAVAITIIGVGVLASLRPPGWWLPAWIAGLSAAIIGLASVVFPDAASTADPVWAVAAILWGVAFVGVAELTQDGSAQTPLGRWRADPPRGTGE